MQTWKDASGKEWVCRITIAEANRLNQEDGIDLLDVDKLTDLISNPLNAVYLLVRAHTEQWKAAGLSHGEFAELCTANEQVATDAANALNEALSDFFRRLRRPALAETVEKANQAAAAVEKESLETIRKRGDEVMRQAVSQTMTKLNQSIDRATAGR